MPDVSARAGEPLFGQPPDYLGRRGILGKAGFNHDFPNGATDAERTAFTRGWKWGIAWLYSEFQKAQRDGQTVVMQVGLDP